MSAGMRVVAVPLEVDVPARVVAPAPPPVEEPALADILAQTGGSPSWLVAALALVAIAVGIALRTRHAH